MTFTYVFFLAGQSLTTAEVNVLMYMLILMFDILVEVDLNNLFKKQEKSCVCVLHIFCMWTIICIDIFLQLKLTLHLLSWFSYRLSWDRIQHLCQLRRHYVHLYAGSLKQSSNSNVSELREMEKDLDPKVLSLIHI